MIPDVIVTWPRNCDYPLWRQFIRNNRTRINEIIIVFMETNQGHDYRSFVRESMFADRPLCVDSPHPGSDDWRNVAVNAGLQYSLHSPWIWFTEQDFFPMKGFFEDAEEKSHTNDVIGVKQGDRIHPCSLLVKRDVVNKTSKNFGIVPGVSDHFSLFTQEVSKWKMAFQSPELYVHMNGLSHNFSLLERGEAPNYNPDKFKKYCESTLKLTVPLSPIYVELVKKYFATYN